MFPFVGYGLFIQNQVIASNENNHPLLKCLLISGVGRTFQQNSDETLQNHAGNFPALLYGNVINPFAERNQVTVKSVQPSS